MFKCVNNPSHTYPQNTHDGFCIKSGCSEVGYLIREDSEVWIHRKQTLDLRKVFSYIFMVVIVLSALVILGIQMFAPSQNTLEPIKVTPAVPQGNQKKVPQKPSNAAPRIANNKIKQPYENKVQPNNGAITFRTTALQDKSHFTITKIITNPPRALAIIDGQQRGRTPLYNVSVDKGHSHIIRFELERHKMESIVIKDGQKDFPIVTLSQE